MTSLQDPAIREDIVRRIGRLSPDCERQWGKMTIHQMVCHLADSYRLATGEQEVEYQSTLWNRTGLKWIALYAPLRWPKNLVTFPELDQEHGGTKPAVFAADLKALQGALDAFVKAVHDGRYADHPLLGKLSPWEMLRWGYLHADHHLRQFGV